MRQVSSVLAFCWVLFLGTGAAGPRPAFADPLSLEQCVGLALKYNLAIESARYDLTVAEANVTGARAAFLPQLSISGNWSKSEEERFFEQGGTFAFSDETWSASGTASLLLFDGLGNIAGYRGARHSRAAAQDQFAAAQQDVAYETERRFFEVLRQKALLEVQQEAVRLSAEQLKKTRAMKELGAATQADVYKAEVDHSNNRLGVLRAERDVEIARASLATYLGRDPRAELALQPEELDVADEYDEAAASAQALEVHPALQSARRSVKASRSGVTEAKSDRYPSLTLWYNTNFYNNEPRDFDDDHIEWTYGLRAQFTIFDGLLTKSSIRRAEAGLINAQRNVESVERDVLLGVRQAYLDLEISRESIAVANEAVRSSQEDLRLAEERYKIGEGTILEVIDAQVNLTRSRTDQVSAVYDRRLAISALRNAIGIMSLQGGAE
jgi:outer membrane protein